MVRALRSERAAGRSARRRRGARWAGAGSELGAQVGAWTRRLWSLELSAGVAAVRLEAVGRLRLELHWLPPLSGEELLCEIGAGGPRLLYAQDGPARQ